MATVSVAASLRVSRSVAARVAVKRRGEIEAWEMTGECGPPPDEPPPPPLPVPLVTDSASTAAADTAMPEQPKIGALPSVNVTVAPSGVGATAAVNDTTVPAGTELADETSVVVVGAEAGGWATVDAA